MEDWKKDVTRFCENTGLVLWFPAFHSTKEIFQPCLTYLHVISLIVAKDTSRGSRGSWEQAGRSRPQNGGSEWCLSAVSGPEPPIFTTPPKHAKPLLCPVLCSLDIMWGCRGMPRGYLATWPCGKGAIEIEIEI